MENNSSIFGNETMNKTNDQQIKKRISIVTEKFIPPVFPNYPDISIVPLSIDFPRTYPNRSVESKVLISNSGIKTEDYKISVTGNKEFSVTVDKISIPAGGTYSIYVKFTPKDIAMFNGSLIFEGRFPYSVSLNGHCVPSIFEMPPAHSNYYLFTRAHTEQIIPLTNKDVAKTLSIVAITDSPAFVVTPNELEIKPLTTTNVVVKYDPSKQSSDNPTLTLKCSQTEESLVLPLKVTEPRRVVTLDFGKTVVNQVLTKQISFEQAEEIPVVPWPFTLKSKGQTQKNAEFAFLSSKQGHFSSKISLSTYDLELVATAIDPPFILRVPQSFPNHPFYLQNTSSEAVHIILSSPNVPLSASQIDIAPGKSVPVSTLLTGNIPSDAKIRVIWATKEGQFEQELPLSPTEDTEISKTELEIKSSTEIPSSQEYSEDIKPKENIQSPLKTSTHLITFNSTQRRFPLTITSSSQITINAPSFVRVPSSYSANEEIMLRARIDADAFGFLTVSNNNDTQRIPVFLISNKVDVDLPDKIELTNSGNSYKKTITITNKGTRNGFIIFAGDDDAPANIAVNPPAAILVPNEEQTFEFSATKEGTISAMICDDICRQIRAVTVPDDFFAKSVVNINDELTDNAKKVIKECNKKDVSKFFKKSLVSHPLQIIIKKQKDKVKIVEKQLVFSGNEEQGITLVNPSSKPVQFRAAADSPYVQIDPMSGIIPANSSLVCKVNLLRKVNSKVTFKCGDSVLTTEIVCNETKSKSKKSISVSQEENLVFPPCSAGTLRRAKLRIANKSQLATCVFASTELPFSCPFQSFRIEPQSFILLPIHFTPQSAGKFTEILKLETDHGSVINFDLFGECK